MKRDVKPGFENSSRSPENIFRFPLPGDTTRKHAPLDGWKEAVRLTERWQRRRERVDSLLEQLTPDLAGRERARAHQLFYGVVRWESRLSAAVEGLFKKNPRGRVRALLMVMGFELLDADASDVPVIVHHAVERAKVLTSPAEAKLVNAVGRTMAGRLADSPAMPWARWAHPEWLVDRWTAEFGVEAVEKLLEWNQTPATVQGRWRAAGEPPAFLQPTPWTGFFSAQPGHGDELRALANQGTIYLQDPSTRLGIELLAPEPGETVLDACAAPGGKSVAIADILAAGPGSRLVALDTPGPRLERLKENLTKAPAGVEVALMPADLLEVDGAFFRKCALPETYDAVLLDAPCSNTGVMRHRVDVKWRLQPDDFARHSAQQFKLLRAAARRVRPGGRLVYSTCSIEAEENEAVVRRFLTRAPEWTLSAHRMAYPWMDGHDGAGAFLLSRSNG